MRHLKEFQKRAVNELIKNISQLLYFQQNNPEMRQTVFFKAPTGSGKTIMLANFINDLTNQVKDKKIGFLWITLARGNLVQQSKEKIENELETSVIRKVYLEDLLRENSFPAKTVAFLNWERAVGKKNRIFQNNEIYTVKNFIAQSKIDLITIIDEEHFAKTWKSQDVIDLFKPKIVLRVSATPKISKEEQNCPKVIVEHDEVVDEQLIRRGYKLNENLPARATIKTIGEDKLLLDEGLKRWEILSNFFFKEKVNINPLVVVQLPKASDNEKKKLIWNVREYLKNDQQITVENGLLAMHLSEEKTKNLESLKENNSKEIVLITKEAIVQGWDCPRAQILVKLRKNSNETFNLQTLGRISRVPEPIKGYYKNDELNYGYVYTFDQKFKDPKNSLSQMVTPCRTLTLPIKDKHRDSVLTKELIVQKSVRSTVISGHDYHETAKAFNQWFRKENDLINEPAGSEKIVKTLERKFGSLDKTKNTFKVYKKGEISADLKINIIEDTITVEYKGVQILEFLFDKFKDDFCFPLERKFQKKNHFIEQFFEYLLVKSDAPFDQIKLDYDYLFDFGFYKNVEIETKKERQARFFCFLIETKKEWSKYLKSFYKYYANEKLKELDASLTSDKYKDHFRFPAEKNYCLKLKDNTLDILDPKKTRPFHGNLYKGFPHYSLTKDFSDPEIEFIVWLEEQYSYQKIDWWMRNGQGNEDWKINYVDSDDNIRNFFPDFIVFKNGQFWIFEVKDDSQQDNNIPYKFRYLKQFCENNALQFAFVMAKDRQTKFNNIDWDDDFNGKNWKTNQEFNWKESQ